MRLRDSINTIEGLMDYAIELGHEVLAYTEHETVANAIKIQEAYEKRKQKYPNFKVILGNEIYLCRDGLDLENFNPEEDKYFHFILLAKDADGHKQIREISTRAWMRSYMQRGMRRVPTYYQDLIDIIYSNQGHVIGSSACLGGKCQQLLVKYMYTSDEKYLNQAIKWLKSMVKLFGQNNFYLEMQPSNNAEQIFVNQQFIELSEQLNIPYIITCDAHYKDKTESSIHEAYLKSQNGEREVGEFYATTYLMNTQEIESFFGYFTQAQLNQAYENILKIKESCEDYNLKKPLKIPKLPWKESYISDTEVRDFEKYIPNLKLFNNSKLEGDKLLSKLIVQGIQQKVDLQNEDAYNEINVELDCIYQSSQVNQANWSYYFLNLQKIIDTIWDAGSITGPSRGSGGGFLILYVLDIIQINALRETTKTYYWRFLNPERVSVLDVDIDVSGLKRPQILQKFREVYGEDRVCNVLTLGTEKSKSAILTAARGLGMDNDIAQYIAALIPSDRGLIRTLSQCYYGDEKEDVKPVKDFVIQMKKYPKLWETASRIEGLVCRSGIHAGGLVFVDEPFTETSALMRAPDGTIISQFDLHDLEKMSLIKYDLLSIEAIDKIQICLELLCQYGYVQDTGNLRETYENTIGIYKLDRTSPEMWQMLWSHRIQSCFQMEKDSGVQGIALTHPESVDDLATLNSVIRLMAQEKGGEQPLNKYARFKNDINLWYQEMESYGLTKDEQKILEPILKISYGICESQERFMMLVQLPECGGFDLNFADKLRKSVAKKDPAAYKECEKEYFQTVTEKGLSQNLCNYVWNICVATSRGYGFNLSHTLAYSLVALQEMNLAYHYPIIFWNCANLIVDSGAIEGDDTKSANYGKIANAVNKIKKQAGTEVQLVDINKSARIFTPDAQHNVIYYGLAGVQNLGSEVITEIIAHRPYSSFDDFMEKTSFNKTVVTMLIKSGAFDQFGERKDIMRYYLESVADTKKRITMQNFNALIEHDLVPDELQFEKRLFVFNKAFKKNCKHGKYLLLDKPNYYKFYSSFFDIDEIKAIGDGSIGIEASKWKKMYDSKMNAAKYHIKEHNQELLTELNNAIVQEYLNKYAVGNYSHWEMEALGMYYHEHELAHIKRKKYDITSFAALPEQPKVARVFKKNDSEFNIYELSRICGTVIAKDDMHSSISLLTPGGNIANVKMNRDYYAKYNKRLSQVQADGTKKTIENGWFQKGTMLVCTGFRRNNTFMLKRYKNTPYHSLYKITNILPSGELEMIYQRADEI